MLRFIDMHLITATLVTVHEKLKRILEVAMKLYFAHPVNVYDTPLEGAMLRLIANRFPGAKIINPNTAECARMYREMKVSTGGTHADHKGMDIFYKMLEDLDGCVSMPFLDCRMGLGVAGETQKTVKSEKSAYLIVPLSRKLTDAEIAQFISNPRNGLFSIKPLDEESVRILRNHPGDLKSKPPFFVVGHEETRLRTYIQYRGQMRPYAEAHNVQLPVPDNFYALDPKKK